MLHIGLGDLGHLQDSTCIYDPYAFRVVNLQWLNIVFSLFKNHDTMYIKPWHPVYDAYMARLGHGMCHIEFIELLFKSILTIYIKMGTIKYMAWLEHRMCHIVLSYKVF